MWFLIAFVFSVKREGGSSPGREDRRMFEEREQDTNWLP
jgi:hypothetical protein